MGGGPHLCPDPRGLDLCGVRLGRLQAHGRRLAVIELAAHRPGIDALEMGIWTRQRAGGDLAASCTTRTGVQYRAIRYSERLAKPRRRLGRSRGDTYDNAMAESFNGLYKWELIYPRGPWRGLDDVEFATLGYVDWFNHRRLHGEITDDNTYVSPAEFEATYYRQRTPALAAVSQTQEQS